MAVYKTFNFPLHHVVHQYPAGDQVQFGRGWSHASEPDLPIQRSFILKFSAMTYVKNPYTGLWLRNGDTRPAPVEQAALDKLKTRSIICLDDFYNEHKLHKKFNYNHFLFGNLVVRFSQAFQIPSPLDSAKNIHNDIPTESFEVRFVEQPE